MKATARSTDLIPNPRMIRPHELALKLPHREPRYFDVDLDRLDKALIETHELILASRSSAHNREVLIEQAKKRLKEAKQIHNHLLNCGVRSGAGNELVELGRIME